MSTLELLREAYVKDVIEIDEFERLVGHVVAGDLVALPMEVQALKRGGPPSRSSVDAILKAAYAPVLPRHDWAKHEQRSKDLASQVESNGRHLAQLEDHARAMARLKYLAHVKER